jgi:hypothetical protein
MATLSGIFLSHSPVGPSPLQVMNLNKDDQIYQNFTEPYATTECLPERPTRGRIIY